MLLRPVMIWVSVIRPGPIGNLCPAAVRKLLYVSTITVK